MFTLYYFTIPTTGREILQQILIRIRDDKFSTGKYFVIGKFNLNKLYFYPYIKVTGSVSFSALRISLTASTNSGASHRSWEAF